MSTAVRNVLIGAVGVLIILLFLATNRYIHWKTESAIKDQTIADLQQTTTKKGESEKVDEQTSTNITQIEKDSKETEIKIRDEVQDRVEEIKKEYDQALKDSQLTAINKDRVIAARDKAVGEVRLQGLWKSFCSGTKDPVACFNSNVGEVTK